MLPYVVAVMPANGRRKMVERAIAAFRAQTYPHCHLVVWDTGEEDLRGLADDRLPPMFPFSDGYPAGFRPVIFPEVAKAHFIGASVGRLRNAVNLYALHHWFSARTFPKVICHWDSDDWSHPRRIEEQVSFLLNAGRQIRLVGYNEVLFADLRGTPQPWRYHHPNPRYVIGSSMMYWRDLWEKMNFRDVPHEDHDWWARNMRWAMATSGFTLEQSRPAGSKATISKSSPRLICTIHGGNTSEGYVPARMRPPEWTVEPGFLDRLSVFNHTEEYENSKRDLREVR